MDIICQTNDRTIDLSCAMAAMLPNGRRSGQMSTPVDRLNLMRLFIRVCEAGSLSAAGRLLGLSQPSTSRQLKQLETMLGVELFKRSTHELVLTEAGKRFVPTAMEMLASWDAATEDARSGRDKFQGSIRVAVPVAIGQTILAEIAVRFLLEHPGVTLDWRLTDEPGDLAAGGYDLWIKAGPIHDDSLIVHELRRSERMILGNAAQSRVLHPMELNRRNAVQLVTFMASQIPLESNDGRKATLTLKPVLATDNIYVALKAVRAGVGYGVLPRWLVQPDIDTGSLVELCPDWHPPPVTLHVAYQQGRFRSARVKRFIEYFRRELLSTSSDDLHRWIEPSEGAPGGSGRRRRKSSDAGAS
jgi:DNA-binding transcriptional LysR family regulator